MTGGSIKISVVSKFVNRTFVVPNPTDVGAIRRSHHLLCFDGVLKIRGFHPTSQRQESVSTPLEFAVCFIGGPIG